MSPIKEAGGRYSIRLFFFSSFYFHLFSWKGWALNKDEKEAEIVNFFLTIFWLLRADVIDVHVGVAANVNIYLGLPVTNTNRCTPTYLGYILPT